MITPRGRCETRPSTGSRAARARRPPRCDDGTPCPRTPRFLTLADVAEVLNTSSAQVYALVRRGELPAIKIGGRGQWRVESAQLEEFIQRMYSETRTFVDEHPFVDAEPERSGPATSRRQGSRSHVRTDLGTSNSVERALLADLAVEGERQGRALLAVAEDGELHLLAGLVGADRDDQRDAVGDPGAVDLGDDVALLEPAVVGGGVRARPSRPRRRRRRTRRSSPSPRSPGSAPRRSRRIWSAVILTCSIGIAKPTPMLPDSPPTDPPVVAIAEFTPDHLGAQVDQRAAGVAGVDRGVGLDGVDVRRVVARSRRW